MRLVASDIPGRLPTQAQSPTPAPAGARGVRAAAAAFWVRAFFWTAEHVPWVVYGARRFLCAGGFRFYRPVRRGTRANARRILGPRADPAQVERLARRTWENFYLFCCDVGRSFSASREQLFSRVESIEGKEHYRAARAAGRGVIVVTAHMGSFEVGLAALREQERRRVHVVFRRDPFERFEKLRSDLRKRLGVKEAPVDDGWTVWMRLRDALLADEAVVLQGDRVMPGQKGEPVPFLGGTLLLPTGPAKMALATGAPIVPIFSVRTPEGRVKLFIEPAVEVGDGGADAAMRQWAAVLERYVKAYPDQWLVLQPALCEDADAAGRAEANGGPG